MKVTVTAEKGPKRLKIVEEERFRQFLSAIKEGQELRITLSTDKDRKDEALNYFFLLVDLYRDAVGCDKEWAYKELKTLFGVGIEVGWWWMDEGVVEYKLYEDIAIPDYPGEYFFYSNQKIYFLKTLSRTRGGYTKDELYILTLQVENKLMQMGVELPEEPRGTA